MVTYDDQSTGRTARTFVYDPELDAWMFWALLNQRSSNITSIVPVNKYTNGYAQETPFFLMRTSPSGTVRSIISYLDPTYIHDEDHSSLLVSMVASYRTSFLDLGDPGAMKTIRETLVDGYFSSASMNVYSNNARSVGSASVTSTLSTIATGTGGALSWPNYALGQTRLREAIRGQNFSFEVSGSGGWSLHRLVPHLKSARPAGPRLVTP
jgi:hypothetical protein